MMKSTLVILTLSAVLASCGQDKAKNTFSTISNDNYKSKIKLDKFVDAVATTSTLDLSKLSKDLPQVVDLTPLMTSVKNQDARGACTFFTLAGIIESTIKNDMGKEVNLSEEYLSYQAKSAGFFPTNEGSAIQYNIYALQRNPVLLLERDWMYQPTWFQTGLKCEKFTESDPLAPKECYSHNAPPAKTLEKAMSIGGMKFGYLQKDVNKLIEFFAKYKRPVSLGIAVNMKGWPTTGDVNYTEELRAECLATPADCGGHAVILTGYDLTKKVFFFKNSWGKEWGHNGYGTIPFETIDKYVDTDFYFAYIDGEEVALPKDYDQAAPEVVLKSFSPTLVKKADGSVDVKITGEIDQLTGQYVYVSGFVTAKKKDIVADPTEDNSPIVMIPKEQSPTKATFVKVQKHYAPEDRTSSSVVWDAKSPLVLNITSAFLKVPVIDDLLRSTEQDAFVRATAYVYTDDSGYKILKRAYLPLKN